MGLVLAASGGMVFKWSAEMVYGETFNFIKNGKEF